MIIERGPYGALEGRLTVGTVTLDGAPVETCRPDAGQAMFLAPGTTTWTVPAGVTSVSFVVVGAGGAGDESSGGGGGALCYASDVSVTPGTAMEVVVGEGGDMLTFSAGGASSFAGVVAGGGGGAAGSGGTGGTGSGGTCFSGGTGGTGVYRAATMDTALGGGGGAGGYAGNGGNGASGSEACPSQSANASAGTGGAGGGGGAGLDNTDCYLWPGSGGSVGLLGQGGDGAAGSSACSCGEVADGGGFGSTSAGLVGAGCAPDPTMQAGKCTVGGVRIIWGEDRAYPATDTKNL